MSSLTRRFVTAAALVACAVGPLAAQQVVVPSGAVRLAAAAAPAMPSPTPRDANGFAKSGFAQFMSSPAGRVLRVVAGAGMIAGGIKMRDDGHRGGGTALAVAGLVPLTAGTFDFCVISPLFGGPFLGRDIRAAAK